MQTALRAIALCSVLAGCSDDSGEDADKDNGSDEGKQNGKPDAAGPDASQPYDPNWTNFDGGLDLVPDAEPPAKQHVWADWTAATVTAQGSASAQLAVSGFDGGIALTYTGGLDNAQLDGGIAYWTPGTAYTSVAVPNPPPPTELIMLAGGNNSVHSLTFSTPVKDPVLAIMSLGSTTTTTVARFDDDFELLSHGPGYYPEGQELKHLPDHKLAGRESNGAIRFKGTFTTIRWTAEISEPWYGLTVGLPSPQ